jgi:hypothetical protein
MPMQAVPFLLRRLGGAYKSGFQNHPQKEALANLDGLLDYIGVDNRRKAAHSD